MVYLNVTELFVDGVWGRVTVQTREKDCYGPEWWTITRVLTEIPALTEAHLWWWVGRRIVGAVLWSAEIPVGRFGPNGVLDRVRFLVYAKDLPALRQRLDDDRVADAVCRLGGLGGEEDPQ